MINNSEYFSFSKNEKVPSNAYNSLRGSHAGQVARASDIMVTVAGGNSKLLTNPSRSSQQSSLHSSIQFYRSGGGNTNALVIINNKVSIRNSSRIGFADLSGDILDLISEYLP